MERNSKDLLIELGLGKFAAGFRTLGVESKADLDFVQAVESGDKKSFD